MGVSAAVAGDGPRISPSNATLITAEMSLASPLFTFDFRTTHSVVESSGVQENFVSHRVN